MRVTSWGLPSGAEGFSTAAARIFSIWIFLAAPLWAGQSLRLNGSQTAANNSVAAQPVTGPCRVEFQVSWTSNPTDGNPAHANACGIFIQFAVNNLSVYSAAGTGAGPVWGCCYNIPLSLFGSNWAIVRYQIIPSGAGGTMTWEAWDISGVRQVSHTVAYSSTTGSYTNGANVGSSGNQNTTWGFFRLYSTTVPLGSREPTFADNGNLLEWKFNTSLTDSSGRGYTATSSAGTPANSCGAAPCYEETSGQNLVTAVIRTNPAAPWGNISWRAGSRVGLDGSASVSMGDAGSTPTLTWQILAGPSKPVWSSHVSVSPTLTGIVFGDYLVQLTATNANGGSAISAQHIGAVAYDDNGVVIPADPKVTNIFGPMIAFGRNPWSWADERELAALNLRYAAYTAKEPYNNYSIANPSWDNPQTGSVDWTWNGKGSVFGAPCTNLSSSITATTLSIPVTNASCLDLSSLPTRITIAGDPNSINQEEIRICSTTGNTGAQTLTACYDGRGIDDASSMPSVLGAQAWSSGAVVGQMLFKGTGTSFLSTLAPGGPGPAGPVLYSTGTVSLTAGSATMTGAGTSWTTGNGVNPGDAVRVAATHGGTGFVFVAYITSVNSTTGITLNRAFPSDADTASGLSYAVILPWYRYFVAHFTRPSPYSGDALTDFGTTGCESDTQCFFNYYLYHDVTGMNGTSHTGTQYSFVDNTGYINQSSLGGVNFYGEDLAWCSLYYRSGLQKALDACAAISDHWIRYPPTSGLGVYGSPLFYGAGVIGATASYVLRGSPSIDNLRPWWNNQFNVANSGCNDWDTRDSGYLGTWIILGGLYDPDTTWKTRYRGLMTTLNARDNSCARANGGVDTNSWANGFLWNTGVMVTLTDGSAAGTGTGLPSTMCDGLEQGTALVTNGSSVVAATSGTFSASATTIVLGGRYYQFTRSDSTHGNISALWPGSSGSVSFMTRNTNLGTLLLNLSSYGTSVNDVSLKNNYACIWNSSTSITLDRVFTKGSGHSTTDSYQQFNYLLSGYGQQPYMLGIKTFGLSQAKSLDGILSLNNGPLATAAGAWIETYGREPATVSTNYGRIYGFCESGGTPTGSFVWTVPGCTSGFDINGLIPGRQLNQEAMVGLTTWYQGNPTPANKAIVDAFYGALWCSAPLNDASISGSCPSNPVGDNASASNLTDNYLAVGKYAGFFFGMGMAHQWPAVRLGGVPAEIPRTLNVTCNISSVTNATKCRVSLTKPNGSTVTNTCTASPCPVTADARQGDHLLKVEYLSASDAVLASGDPEPVPVN